VKQETIYLSEYQAPYYVIETVDLTLMLNEEKTEVTSVLRVRKNHEENYPLELDGEGLTLISIVLNDQSLHESEYELLGDRLILHNLPQTFTLTIKNSIEPITNSALEGLYKSGDILCTQNEPEGFRRITYFIDRPDNMSVYTTTLVGDKTDYPVLLSNGNLVETGELENNQHYATWHDPFAKPSYLYAVVAGDLGVLQDTFQTQSGRIIDLEIYCDLGNEVKCTYAMQALKDAMRWDEEKFNLEYDLDRYMIVAVDSFNMGAMENKGLNIFNSHYVLVDPQTATDADYLGVQSVIAHEYFHNWTGNRVTCRDWFQLTLKEGLTVYRDQEFSSDLNDRSIQRISDVASLRARQFLEDASPNAHPIQPKSFVEINNFYTATVYEKGAEVIRMLEKIVGREGFAKGLANYFKHYDGMAVTTEDFIRASEEANGVDLTQFRRWYDQVGTPMVTIETQQQGEHYHLVILQEGHATPLHIPLAFQLMGEDGHIVDEGTLQLTEKEQRFTFFAQQPFLSINRGFSAPVNIEIDQSFDQKVWIINHDSDGFNKNEAMKSLYLSWFNEPSFDEAKMITLFGNVLANETISDQLKAKLLTLPNDEELIATQELLDIETIVTKRKTIKEKIAQVHKNQMVEVINTLNNSAYALTPDQIGRRELRLVLLSYLKQSEQQRIKDLYNQADNMTDKFGALRLLSDGFDTSTTELEDFYTLYKDDMLVMSKYLAVQAGADHGSVLASIKQLEQSDVYDNKVPNLVRALIGAFTRNYRYFHAKDGSGYRYVCEKILELDIFNPSISSTLAKTFKAYNKMPSDLKEKATEALTMVLKTEGISKNLYEVVEQTIIPTAVNYTYI
jgi:aminopeptidase N